MAIYHKFFDFQCLTRGIHKYFPIPTGFKNGRFYSSKIDNIPVKNDNFKS